jgi:hypothetical protein
MSAPLSLFAESRSAGQSVIGPLILRQRSRDFVRQHFGLLPIPVIRPCGRE